jgi:hypothetical protein
MEKIIDKDAVSDCCGAKVKQVTGFFDGSERGRFNFLMCEHCGEPCQIKQMHDTQIQLL